MIGDKAALEIFKIPMSFTITRRISDMSAGIIYMICQQI